MQPFARLRFIPRKRWRVAPVFHVPSLVFQYFSMLHRIFSLFFHSLTGNFHFLFHFRQNMVIPCGFPPCVFHSNRFPRHRFFRRPNRCEHDARRHQAGPEGPATERGADPTAHRGRRGSDMPGRAVPRESLRAQLRHVGRPEQSDVMPHYRLDGRKRFGMVAFQRSGGDAQHRRGLFGVHPPAATQKNEINKHGAPPACRLLRCRYAARPAPKHERFGHHNTQTSIEHKC